MFISGPSNEDMRKQREKADRRLHKSKMKLLRGIREATTGNIDEDDLKVRALEELDTPGKMRILAKLEEQYSYWCGYPAPQEQALARRAIDEFKAGNYAHKTIHRYITSRDIVGD